ncbi:MAG: hypothetical protein AMXMBFR84_03390 [Candidatus Hydrogenedentota bacterium]
MQMVKVRLRKPTRVFTFLSKDSEIKRNDNLIVRSDRGLEFGTAILPPEPCAEDLEQRYKMNVVRKATPHDLTSFMQIQIEEGRAMEIAREKVNSRNLPMKMVDVEYTFDKQRVMFYFVAADRVDFRQLVRDLAQELKTRIELRHIQVRDEAKIKGGLGVCGRELCCSTWLTEFKPISMKMAKRQNLSLNPTKISGQCGRLLCCLGYENEVYQMRKRDEQNALAQQAAMEEDDIPDSELAALEDEPASRATARTGDRSPGGQRPQGPRRGDDRPQGTQGRRPDQGPSGQRPDRGGRPERPRPEPQAGSGRPDRPDRPDRGPRPERPQQEPRSERPVQSMPPVRTEAPASPGPDSDQPSPDGGAAEGQDSKRRGRRRRRRRNRPGGGES